MDNQQFIPGKNIPENIIFSCFGCMSNTGLLAGLGSIKTVEELGLKKVGIGCLAGIPLDLPSVIGKSKASKHIISVDGCPNQCAKKILENSGLDPIPISVVNDLHIKKFSLSDDLPSNSSKNMTEYVTKEEIEIVKNYIINILDNLK